MGDLLARRHETLVPFFFQSIIPGFECFGPLVIIVTIPSVGHGNNIVVYIFFFFSPGFRPTADSFTWRRRRRIERWLLVVYVQRRLRRPAGKRTVAGSFIKAHYNAYACVITIISVYYFTPRGRSGGHNWDPSGRLGRFNLRIIIFQNGKNKSYGELREVDEKRKKKNYLYIVLYVRADELFIEVVVKVSARHRRAGDDGVYNNSYNI